MNLYHVTKFFPCFSFTVYCFYTKISSFMPVLSTRIVLDCFYLLILYSEKFSTDVCRLPYAVNVNLNLSNIWRIPWVEFFLTVLKKTNKQSGLSEFTVLKEKNFKPVPLLCFSTTLQCLSVILKQMIQTTGTNSSSTFLVLRCNTNLHQWAHYYSQIVVDMWLWIM